MKKYLLYRWLWLAIVMFASANVFAGPRDEEFANVTVLTHKTNSQIAYTYTITNSGNRTIRGFSVGFDYYTGDSELCGDFPLEVLSPESWKSIIIRLEESICYEVRWERVEGTDGLTPDMTKSGFTVLMAKPMPQLVSGHWTAVVLGSPTFVSSTIKQQGSSPDDLIPPSMTIATEPSVIWPPNNGMTDVTVKITVTDDRDPAPVISLVSITCNDECDLQNDVQGAVIGTSDFNFSVRATRMGQTKRGRVYTALYSAVDSAGNKSEISAEIVVPHDQRKK